MRRSFLLLTACGVALAAAAFLGACKQQQAGAPVDEDAGAEENGGTSSPKGDDDDTAEQGTPAEPPNGVPCDVQAVIENRCITCHGATNAKGPALLKFEDFAAKSTRDPMKTRGQVSADLMKSKEMPQKPGVATDDEIKTVDDWVTTGMTKSTEACVLAPADAGAGAGVDAGADAGAGGVDAGLCTSGGRWTQGNTKSPLMHPGGACIGCHQTTAGGPALSFAGTVYAGARDVDDCNGTDAPVTVVIRDKNRNTFTAQTNAAGNFMIATETLQGLNVRAPFTVEVRQPGKPTRKMNRTITGGDCNGCHTASGNPGRVLQPGVP